MSDFLIARFITELFVQKYSTGTPEQFIYCLNSCRINCTTAPGLLVMSSDRQTEYFWNDVISILQRNKLEDGKYKSISHTIL